MASAPFSERFREKRTETPDITVEQALKVLEGAAKSPQQHAIAKSAFRVFDGAHSADATPTSDRDTPGAKAARAQTPLNLQGAKDGGQPTGAKA